MRGLAAALVLLAGCAELGVVSDGTSISVGRPNHGRILDGARLPDSGEGFFTREIWATRGQRYGTDELLDLLAAVARRMAPLTGGTRLVIADLSGQGGGPAYTWHRSHQSGRDVDLLYYMRDGEGRPMEADAMHVFSPGGVARDGSGISVDVPRTWLLVKALVTAPEAAVQWVFMYEPIAARLIAHAESIGEPPAVIARARAALKQPGDSARHDDHMHVRVYCAPADRAYGCVDAGPMELLAEHEADHAADGELAAAVAGAAGGQQGAQPAAGGAAASPGAAVSASAPAPAAAPGRDAGAAGSSPYGVLGRALRARPHRLELRRGR